MSLSVHIRDRVEHLEQISKSVQSNVPEHERSPQFIRVHTGMLASNMVGAAMYRVPGDYYSRSLAWRARLLGGGCTTHHLCKTLVLENTSTATPLVVDDLSAPLSMQRYVAVVVQYTSKLDLEALAKAVGTPRYVLAPSDAATKLTGFGHGGMTPFGTLSHIPVVIAKAIISSLPPPCYIWLGGGDVDVKARVFLSQVMQEGKVAASQGGGGRGVGGGGGVSGGKVSDYVPAVIACTVPREGDDFDEDEL
jgi:prolyl-tRNA editing enzyme YbaK/EbsC (Cys-tRNA(Pro) deacylase)